MLCVAGLAGAARADVQVEIANGDKVTGTGEYKVCAARVEPVVGSRAAEVFPGSYARDV